MMHKREIDAQRLTSRLKKDDIQYLSKLGIFISIDNVNSLPILYTC